MKKVFSFLIMFSMVVSSSGFLPLIANAQGAPEDKIDICHKAGDNWNFADTPAGQALEGHLGHGDFLYGEPVEATTEEKDAWCLANAPTPTPTPEDGKIHIFKFIDEEQATIDSADSASFPMYTTTYSAPFTLDLDGWTEGDAPYEASTSTITAGGSYTANEVLDTDLVGASCQDGKPYALTGYTSGASMDDAENATKSLTPPIFSIDGDGYMIVWNEKCENENQDPTATISAQKIVCPTENLLPNWGSGGSSITSTTASDFITANPTCHLEPWNFEWAPETGNPGDNITEAGNPWTTFTTNATVPAGAKVWVREQMPVSGYVPFSGDTNGEDGWSDVSAELYCNDDVLNYDNFDYIDPVVANTTYHCVGFNVSTAPQCNAEATSTIKSDTSTEVDGGNSVALSYIHPAWTASIPEATWIWATDPVESPTNDANLTKVFTKTFTIVGTPTAGTLDIAADNNYSVKVNGNIVPVVFNEDNFRSDTQDSYDVTSFLVNGLNTLEFTVTNKEIDESADPANNPAGLLYKLSVSNNECVTPPVEDVCTNIPGNQPTLPEGYHFASAGICVADELPLACNPDVNLLENGSFESPALINPSWSIIPDSNPALKWLVAWVGSPLDGTLGLEIQNHVAGDPSDGDQFAELDGDHPVKITQNITTIPGKEYKLSFKYSPRPGSESGTNKIEARAEGNLLGAVLSGIGGVTTNWTSENRTFVATDSNTAIEFIDTDIDNSFGGYIDNVSLTCVGEPTPNPEEAETIQVHILKYLGDELADSDSTGGYQFGMSATWMTANLNGGISTSGNYVLGNNHGGALDQYGADTSPMEVPADYTTSEITDGDSNVLPIGAQCTEGKYRLVGYSFGDTKGDALGAEQTETAPIFTDLEKDQTVIVWNEKCPDIQDDGDESSQEFPACSDSIDNDEDGLEDYPADPGCSSADDDNETDLINENDSGQGGGGGGGGSSGSRRNTPVATGQVLGAETSCGIYVDKFLKKGLKNNNIEAVKKVQTFLNDYTPFTPKLVIDGVFGSNTEAAIKAFQASHKEKVMNPWKLLFPTGIFYLTTQTEVNNIMCPELNLPIPSNLMPFSKNPNTPKI